MLPLEFTIDGPPLSHQTHNRSRLRAWQRLVRQAASRYWGGGAPVADAVKITVVYFHEGPSVRIDDDNLLKPIQDALNGLVYEDDGQITDAVVRKTQIDTPFCVRRASMVLLEGFHRGNEFLYILIEAAPDHTQLLLP